MWAHVRIGDTERGRVFAVRSLLRRALLAAVLACCALIFSRAAFSGEVTNIEPELGGASPVTGASQLSGGAVAAGIGFVWGHGDVVYQGQRHHFSVSGLSIVDVGVANTTATGVVYNLRNLDDLNGNYVAATAGLTVAGGGSAEYLKNEHGVVIKLLSTSRGLRFNLSANGMKVQLQS